MANTVKNKTLEKGTIKESKKERIGPKDTEETVRALLYAPTESALLLNTEGTILAINEVAAQRLGQAASELVGQSALDFLPPDLYKSVRAKHNEAIRTGKPVRSNYEREKRIYDYNIYPVFNTETEIEAVAVYASDITEIVEKEKILRESEERYRNLFENAQAGVFRMSMDSQEFMTVNRKFAEISGYSIEEILTKPTPVRLVRPDDKKYIMGELKEKGVLENFEIQVLARNGEIRTLLATMKLFKNKRYIEGSVINISERKKAEDELIKAHAKLAKSNALLKTEIKERRQAEESLRAREKELKAKADDLHEANIALKVLLEHRDKDRVELEEKVVANVKQLVEPYLEELKKCKLTPAQKTYHSIIKTNLDEIISPFVRSLTLKHLNLTPAEIRVANLVKQGKTTKEIADLLNLSWQTVEFQRKEIRKKIGIRNMKANLRTHLLHNFTG